MKKIKEKVLFAKPIQNRSYVKAQSSAKTLRQRVMGHIGNSLLILFCLAILLLSLHGLPGNPNQQQLNQTKWSANGPFDSSNERGRYALLYSLIENHSFQFSLDLAEFSSPDLAYNNGQFVSLFAPGVSFIIIPGYLLGKYFGLAQVGAFATIALFALLNVLLLRAIAIRLGAHPIAATLGSFTFLFASPAFSYATTLFEHHISVFFILAGIYLLIRYSNFLSLAIIWLLCVASVTVDYPNFFMMFPIGIAALGRIFVYRKTEKTVELQVRTLRIVTFLTAILPLAFFFWYNQMSYGSPTQLSGTLQRVTSIQNGKPVFEGQQAPQPQSNNTNIQESAPKLPEKSTLNFFQSRLLLGGFYVHFISPDRGILLYTPIILLGFIGMAYAVKKKQPYTGLLIAVIGSNILLYSMWDDPYGGWAFGSRYLIPSYALLSIFIALLLTHLRKSNIFLLAFLTVFSYSVSVNTLGALTSNLNPPQVEAVSLAKSTNTKQEYTYVRNINELNDNQSRSFIYQLVAQNYISGWNYYTSLTVFIIGVASLILFRFRMITKKAKLPLEGGRKEYAI